MKICLVSDQLVGFHKNWSGAEMVCQHLAEILKKEGQKVVFITTSFEKKGSSPFVFQVPASNFKNPFLQKIASLFSRFSGTVHSFRYLKKEKPDVVHFLHSNYLFVPVMISCRLLGIPAAFTVLDYYIICPRNNLRMNDGRICQSREGLNCSRCVSMPKLSERFLFRRFLKNLKGIITFTETSKMRLAKHGIPAEKIKVIYTYVPPSDPKLKNKKAKSKVVKNSILFVGTFFEYKGLQVLIKALPKILSQVPGAKLKIVGIGYEQDRLRLEKLINELGISRSIEFLYRKSNQEVSELIAASEMVVVPEQWPSDFGPLILVEAMLGSKPVVASKIGAISEFIKSGKNGFLVEYDQPKRFAEKISYLLKNKAAARAMGREAGKSMKKFFESSQSRELSQLLELYDNIKTI